MQQVLDVLKREPERWWTAKEVATAMTIHRARASYSLGGLYARHRVERRSTAAAGAQAAWEWRMAPPIVEPEAPA